MSTYENANVSSIQAIVALVTEPEVIDGGAFPQRNFWTVIPAGGSGTRLWPLSRTQTPKFFLSLVGDRRSLLQQTVDRLSFVSETQHTFVVCGAPHAARVMLQLPELDPAQVLIEPFPMGTCPAIALAAAIIERQDPEAIMGSFAADHAVGNLPAFTAAVRTAYETAAEGWLVTLGCTPTRPETGYGYIARGNTALCSSENGDAYPVELFVEKPDLETAIGYVASGNYLWNSGMFVWSVGTFMEELRKYQPIIAEGVETIARAWGSPEFPQVMGEIWPLLPSISVDNGLMEMSDRIAVVPTEMEWSDIGDWHGLGNLLEHDETGNCTRGDIVNIGSVDSFVWSDTERVISIVGLDNVVVVDTPDALLVANRAHAQLVRTTVTRLKENNRMDLC